MQPFLLGAEMAKWNDGSSWNSGIRWNVSGIIKGIRKTYNAFDALYKTLRSR